MSYFSPDLIRSIPKITFAIALLLSFESAFALDLDVRSNKSSRLDFSLVIDNGSVEVEDDFTEAELDLLRIGIVSFEVPSTGPQFGLLLGYAYVDFAGNTAYETLEMDGYYLGIAVRGYLVQQQHFSLSIYSHYLYQSVDGKQDEASATLSWEELLAEVVLEYRLQSIGVLYAGFNGGLVDTRYRYRGNVNARVDLENKNQSGALIGFHYTLNPLETVGIRVQRSAISGVQLQFRKLF